MRCVPSGLTAISWALPSNPEVQLKAISFEVGDQERPDRKRAGQVAMTRGAAAPVVGTTSRSRPDPRPVGASTKASQRPSGDHCAAFASLGTSAAAGIPLCASGTVSPLLSRVAIKTGGPGGGPGGNPGSDHGELLKTSCLLSGENPRISSLSPPTCDDTSLGLRPVSFTSKIPSGQCGVPQVVANATCSRLGLTIGLQGSQPPPGQLGRTIGFGFPPCRPTLNKMSLLFSNTIRPPGTQVSCPQHPDCASGRPRMV